MANLIADEFMSLDGVAQAPSYPDEDPDGGFQGGWHTTYLDEQSLQWVAGNVTAADGYLLGRRTYEIFAAHWPNAAPEEQALARPLNERPKYVVSTTLAAPLPWQNSQLLPGPNAADAVRALKAEQDGAIHVIGSTRLVQTLIAHRLIDEFRLMIDPLVIGAGKRFFSDLQAPLQLNLTEHTVTSTGAVLASYTLARPAGST
jgi:dihydrofolate reductase